MYHYYYNLVIAACAVELYAAFDHEIFRSAHRKNQLRVVARKQTPEAAQIREESDMEYQSAPSSDSEWERVEGQENQ